MTGLEEFLAGLEERAVAYRRRSAEIDAEARLEAGLAGSKS
jgi:hypothetical protein